MNETLWIALLVALTMIGGRLAKLYPRLPKGLMPAVALLIGAGLYLAKAALLDGVPVADALVSWQVLVTGAGAIVGHDLIKPVLSRWLGEDWAVIIMGRLDARQPKKQPGVAVGYKGQMGQLLIIISLALGASGCQLVGPALAALQTAVTSAQGSQWLGSVLGQAEKGSEAYFDRHPNLDRQRDVEAALRAVWGYLAMHDRALAMADAIDSGDAGAIRAELLQSWGVLRAMLDSMGILDARPPAGGAEGSGPMPVPLSLPSLTEVDARL